MSILCLKIREYLVSLLYILITPHTLCKYSPYLPQIENNIYKYSLSL